jgi:hypothetical protein
MLCGKADGLHAGRVKYDQLWQMNDILVVVNEPGARLAHEGNSRMSEMTVRKLAVRLRKYASGAMVEGADLSRAAAYLDQMAREIEELRAALRELESRSPQERQSDPATPR